jgi:hypothetical protein
MLQPVGEEVFLLILDVLGKGRAPNYSHLSPPAKTNENPTKTWKQNHEKESFCKTTQGMKRQAGKIH